MQQQIPLAEWLKLASINIDKAAELTGLAPSQIRYLEELMGRDSSGNAGKHRRYTFADMPILLRAGRLFTEGKRPHEIADELRSTERSTEIGEVETMRLIAELLPRCILAVRALIELTVLMEMHQAEQAAQDLLAELERVSKLAEK